MPYHRWRENAFLGQSDRLFAKVPYIVAGIYALVSATWIVFSDRLLVSLAGDYSQYQYLQTYKGWLFVSISALMILLVLRGAWKGIFAVYETSLESERRLQLALTSADGGVWEMNLANGDPKITFISPELTGRLGLPPTHRLSMAELRARRHPDDLERIDRILEDFITSGGQRPYDVRYRVRTNDGSYRWVHSRGNIVSDESGTAQRMVGVSLDITEQMEAEERVRQLLRFDPLTGLAKPHKFLADVDHALATITPVAVLAVVQVKLLDLNNLIEESETVEDAQIIHIIGDRLHALSDSAVLASRVSTDVFAIATPAMQTAEAVHSLVQHVLDRISEPMQLAGRCVRVRFHTGAALYSGDGANAHGLLRNSGHALDEADRTADAGIRWFTDGVNSRFRQRNTRLRDLASAVVNREIECHFQPIIDLSTGRTAGFEALARWRTTGEGLLAPDQFIGLAEEFGHIGQIGEDVLRQACRAAASWHVGSERAPFVAVNVSPMQLDDPVFPAVVARVLADSGLSPSRLELEITESALTKDPEAAAQRLETFRRLGISIALDDFGTGYSSLSLLIRFPFTRLKIDRSFLTGYGLRRESTIIVDMIIDLGEHLGLSITAEGVETRKQAEMLSRRGVTFAQGYRFSRPVASENVQALLDKAWPIESGNWKAIRPERTKRQWRGPSKLSKPSNQP
ncbi:EAL domain-containing protein [Mesorhizobium sp. AR10]|uniref:putative bifunctional diguanylate cyclase/phosphodiesterase n=1 Tax=Mesorhizobium sp. AR10 TaxID=2865839 RepID=UPI002160FC38|nr:bifunctional diguanylate cyclase/phosphodiesterase [Mesorhizobium sp. AR10]UVK40997.1 EAL domain-containing protein [Mesorhizobium sp. AR10]